MSNTLFTKVDYTLSSLTDDIANGRLGLPDIQRPFVWKNVKVRDLFDSMYRGCPPSQTGSVRWVRWIDRERRWARHPEIRVGNA